MQRGTRPDSDDLAVGTAPFLPGAAGVCEDHVVAEEGLVVSVEGFGWFWLDSLPLHLLHELHHVFALLLHHWDERTV